MASVAASWSAAVAGHGCEFCLCTLCSVWCGCWGVRRGHRLLVLVIVRKQLFGVDLSAVNSADS
eukprot:833734-Rhodomonas_salina.1